MSMEAAIRLSRFLRKVRETDPELTVQKLQILVEVMMNPGIEQQSLILKVDQTRSAVSKNLADWSEITSRKKPGPGLIESRIDPRNRVIRTIHPTSEGRKRWAEMISTLS